MLQHREISKLLGQAIEQSGDGGSDGVLFASLLSAKGLPLITVGPPTDHTSTQGISPDSLRMYSLMATNLFGQQEKTGDESLDCWAVLDIDTFLRAAMRKFATTSSSENGPQTVFYTVLFYTAAFPDAQAKVRLDLVTEALAAGLSGYRSS